MKTLTGVYNPTQADDKRYRKKLKDRIEKIYFTFTFPYMNRIYDSGIICAVFFGNILNLK